MPIRVRALSTSNPFPRLELALPLFCNSFFFCASSPKSTANCAESCFQVSLYLNEHLLYILLTFVSRSLVQKSGVMFNFSHLCDLFKLLAISPLKSWFWRVK